MGIYDNIYFTKEYQNSLETCRKAVSGECSEEYTIELDLEYTLWCGRYHTEQDGFCRCRLFSSEGRAVFEYNINYDDDFGSFTAVFESTEGERYFIFKEDLYGYSVLRLSDMECMHYIPRGEERKGAVTGESFIFTDFHYCRNANIAAAGGCFWAAPSDVALLDLSDPLREPDKYTLLFPIINPERDYDRIEDVDFLRWEKDGRLIVTADGAAGKEEYAFSVKSLKRFMAAED